MRELNAYLADKDKTEDVGNRLIAAILRLPHSKRRNPYANNGTAASTGNSRQRFGRAPGDPTVADYKCMLHRMGNHTQGDERCLRKKKHAGKPPISSPSAAAIAATPEFVASVVNLLCDMYTEDNSSQDKINNSSQYVIAPLLDTAATNHLTNSESALSNKKGLSISLQLADGSKSQSHAVGDALVLTTGTPLSLEDVLCVPTLVNDLVSASHLARN